MATIDLRESVLDYINNKADSRFLRLVNALAKSYQEEEFTERISIEQYNKELDASEKEIELGNFYTHSEVRKRANQWGTK